MFTLKKKLKIIESRKSEKLTDANDALAFLRRQNKAQKAEIRELRRRCDKLASVIVRIKSELRGIEE